MVTEGNAWNFYRFDSSFGPQIGSIPHMLNTPKDLLAVLTSLLSIDQNDKALRESAISDAGGVQIASGMQFIFFSEGMVTS